jgi:tight adherence protein C
MSPTVLGAAAGLLAGVGTWLLAAHVRARRPRLDRRLAPYLRQPARTPSGAYTTRVGGPLATAERLLGPALADAVQVLERLGTPAAELERRLTRAGSARTVDETRAEQVVSGVVGAAGGLVVALGAVGTRGASPVLGAAVVAVAALAGVVLHHLALTRAVRRREERLLAELPTVAELLALAVAAGEGAAGALERVAGTCHGELARELAVAVADTRAGTPLVVALERLEDRTGLPALSRFAEALAVAVERGTPLADVLRAQAADVREAARRDLMEAGGRKEVAMMVPVVFLLLPVTVVFAVFPSLSALRLDL